MISPTREHHKLIWDALLCFNTKYLTDNSILFGGGTRIALELGEYRESTDIDFFCSGATAYRAVRSEVTSDSLGKIVYPSPAFEITREVRADRDAVRTFITPRTSSTPIKLEFVHFDICDVLPATDDSLFPVPIVNRDTCYVTKLLANADRYTDSSKKDIFDLCMMRREWGEIPDNAWESADKVYSLKTVVTGMIKALESLSADYAKTLNVATNELMIDSDLAKQLIEDIAPTLLAEAKSKQPE